MTGIIEIENLVKDYEVGFFRKRRVRALDNLSITVNQGEIFGFRCGALWDVGHWTPQVGTMQELNKQWRGPAPGRR